MVENTVSSNAAALQFLKLGGSLITDKNHPQTPRLDVLARLAGELARARRSNPALRLVLGHGSGSFGHVSGRRYGTRQGVHTLEEWKGFTEVWRDAAQLNRLVMDTLGQAGLPVLGFSPLASVVAADGQVEQWNLTPIRSALQAGLLPVVYGDVVFDRVRGGTILSTEDLFTHLARHLRPHTLLLAGIEKGVWADYPQCHELIEEITPQNIASFASALGGSTATDVTGGMASKVHQSLILGEEIPGLEVLIFSGEIPGLVEQALAGDRPGTLIRAISSRKF